jgi:hypothetical protein
MSYDDEPKLDPVAKSRSDGMNRADRRQYEREERRAAKRALIERIGRHL